MLTVVHPIRYLDIISYQHLSFDLCLRISKTSLMQVIKLNPSYLQFTKPQGIKGLCLEVQFNYDEFNMESLQ